MVVKKKRASPLRAAYERAVRETWTAAEDEHDPLITDEQRARREAAARANQELLAQIRARFSSE